MTKKTNILIIILVIISIISLSFGVYNFSQSIIKLKEEEQIIGKWKNNQQFCDGKSPCKDLEVIYEFKKDGTCVVNNEYNCTYRNGIISFNDGVVCEYYLNIGNKDILKIQDGTYQYIASNARDLVGYSVYLERIK